MAVSTTAPVTGEVVVWDFNTGKMHPYASDQDKFGQAHLSSDGKTLGVVGTSAAKKAPIFRRIDIATMEVKGEYPTASLSGIARQVFDPDLRTFAVVTHHQTNHLKVLDPELNAIKWGKVFSSSIGDIAYSPNGAWLAVGLADNRILILNARTGAEVLDLRGHLQTIRKLRFSPDGRYLASSDVTNDCRTWDIGDWLK
jgi:WD40 repeat protein